VPDFPIDGELLERLIEKYFELRAENRAYLAMVSRASITNPTKALQYANLWKKEVAVQRAETEGHRSILRNSLDSGDFAAVQRILFALFPPH
jgi:hypothetical protein